MKLSDYVVSYLGRKGVTAIFGYQGSSVSHLIDSIRTVDGMKYIQNYHEQASAFSANGFSQASGGFGVALACSGPGATNLITGIANAFFDSVPCLFLTGQVSTPEMKQALKVRQLGFQETDIVSIVKPITKYAVTVLDPARIRQELDRAVHLMLDGRAGPVLIDLPHNVQGSVIDEHQLDLQGGPGAALVPEPNSTLLQAEFQQARDLIEQAKKPLVLIGGGALSLRGSGLIEKFIRDYDLPVVASLRGLDVVAHDNPSHFGFLGAYGNRHANLAIAHADVLVVLGSRLDNRQTGGAATFAVNARIIRVEIDVEEIDSSVKGFLNLNCSCEYFLRTMKPVSVEKKLNSAWLNVLRTWRERFSLAVQQDGPNCVDPNEFFTLISRQMRKNSIITVDVGQHQMWAAQSLSPNTDQFFLCSGGHGAMGYSLPASIGAYYAKPDHQIISVSGDGGIQMNLQELQTIAREKLPIKVIVMNNSSLGLIRDYQEKALGGRRIGSVEGFSSPSFEKIAFAFGLDYHCIRDTRSMSELKQYLEVDGPVFLEVLISENSRVNPEPTYRRGLDAQSPMLTEAEFQQIEREADLEKS